jgi:hypothetical protein
MAKIAVYRFHRFRQEAMHHKNEYDPSEESSCRPFMQFEFQIPLAPTEEKNLDAYPQLILRARV